MTTIPTTIIARIDAAYEEKEGQQKPRFHLGASAIGHRCERWLWLSFRWCAQEKFDGRMLRLFQRGQREEDYAIGNLRAAGLEVLETDPETGRQFRFFSGGFGGSCDGIILSGVPEAPHKRHLLEIKTHSRKSFDDLAAKGVKESKPQHYVQMQVYMAAFDLDAAIYYAVCKDDDRLHIERVKYEKEVADWAVRRAERIIQDNRMPPRLGKDATWHECKFCPAADICYRSAPPPTNCRTCVHGSMKMDGAWHCAKWGADVPEDVQLKGCDEHSILDDLIPF